ncbi:secondary thiamine-phosphate synthase enzyme YjbQ [Vulgatibacter sp.]|uniref:secondary thiamine-phosphate synthase enzyme YjbQ n=1 Tax=Vulgatibacter sp. TaxID=1971226 RepID=UPI0035693609
MPRTLNVLEIQTQTADEFVDLTAKVKAVVQQSGVTAGTVVVFCPHTTAGITVQENTDPALKEDLFEALERMVPRDRPQKHGEGNAHAHMKAAMIGSSATVLVEGGKLLLGQWQAIYFVEFDGPRRRTVQVKVMAG